MGDILDMLKKNEEIAKKFLKVESALNSADTPSKLLETLLKQLEVEFNIPYVWFTFVQRTGNEDLIRHLAMAESLRGQVGILDEASFTEILPQKNLPVLANENLRPFYRLFPQTRKFFLKSIAVVPLILNGLLIGSLNLGDASPERYYPGMDTSLLQQLAGKVSEHLVRMVPPPRKKSGKSGVSQDLTGSEPGVSGSESEK
ncbi:GAF domain-containing protein [Syntrophus gentianae]|uniref:GAF domain-containing protein n=1 Tax=Syntrophus gentianae TaxID=43775 RepID=A0A1H7X6B7_9BACT|nr:GAF domain-containing protein [Syntrophus gentianae]